MITFEECIEYIEHELLGAKLLPQHIDILRKVYNNEQVYYKLARGSGKQSLLSSIQFLFSIAHEEDEHSEY